MASSEVGIVSTSDPFGCVLKDHNRRDHLFRDPNDPSSTATTNSSATTTTNTNSIVKSNSTFQKNIKDIVRDHLQSCITISPTKPTNDDGPDENSNSNTTDVVVNPNPPNPRNRFTSSGCCGRAIRNRRSNNHRHQPLPNNNQHRSDASDDDDEGEQPPRLFPPPTMSRRQARVLDRWAAQQAHETITTAKRENPQADIPTLSSSGENVSTKASSSSFSFPREPSPAPSDCSSSSAPVSSLVQKWSGKIPPPTPPLSTVTAPTSHSTSQHYHHHHHHHLPPHPLNIDLHDSNHPSTSAYTGFQFRTSSSRANSVASSAAESSCHHDNDSISDWESDRGGGGTNTAAPTEWHSVDDSGVEEGGSDRGKKRKEGERVKVSEIIKKWPAGTKGKRKLSGIESGGEEENGGGEVSAAEQRNHQLPPLVMPLMSRLRIELGHQQQGGDPGGFFATPALCSPRIRGRQAAEDVIARIERDRYDEIERLSDRCPVTKFPQRGRIQAMVKLMFLRREVIAADQHQYRDQAPPPRRATNQKPNRPQQQQKRQVTVSGDELESPPRRAPNQKSNRPLQQKTREVSASGDELESPPRRASNQKSNRPQQQKTREVSASGDELESPPRRASNQKSNQPLQQKREVSASEDEQRPPLSKEKSNQLQQQQQQKRELSVSDDEQVPPPRRIRNTEKSSKSQQQLHNGKVSAGAKDDDRQRRDQESPARRACKEKSNQLHQQLSPILVTTEDERRRHQEQVTSPSRRSVEKANQMQHREQNEGSASSSPSSVSSIRERFNNVKAAPQKSDGKTRKPGIAVETSSNNYLEHHTNTDKACIYGTAPSSPSPPQVVGGSNHKVETNSPILKRDKISLKVVSAAKAFVDAGKRPDPQKELMEKIAKIAANNLAEDKQERASSDATVSRKAAPPAAPPPPPPPPPTLPPIKTLRSLTLAPPPPSGAVAVAKSATASVPSNRLGEAFDSQEDNPSTSTSSSSPGVVWHDSASYEGVVYGSSDASMSYASWAAEETDEDDEEVSVDHQYYEPNLEWIDTIARPRSYWEDQRQARYQEVFQSSANVEIRQLLERGSVSAVLASGFRERIDQLVMSCVQRQTLGPEIFDDEDEDDHSMMMLIRSQMQPLNRGEEEQPHREEEIAREGEDQGHVMDSVVEAREDAGDRRSRHEEELDDAEEHRSLSSYQDTELISNNSDNADGSTVHQRQQQPESLTIHNGSLFKNGTSMEMELIFDLRSHMVQLYHEMAELRKSINSCTQMQEKMMHKFMKDEVSTASVSPSDSERKHKNESQRKKAPKKGCCCICYEKKIDSLLYRCGHMCTCFKCAHELQSSEGKCPICQAQILDVVRAYIDN